MLYLPKFILTTDGTIECVMRHTWCQLVWYLIADVGPSNYLMLWCVDTKCKPPLPTMWYGPCTQQMMPSVVSMNVGKYNIFYRPDEAMLFVIVKACLHLKIILLFITLKDFILLINGLALFFQ